MKTFLLAVGAIALVAPVQAEDSVEARLAEVDAAVHDMAPATTCFSATDCRVESSAVTPDGGAVWKIVTPAGITRCYAPIATGVFRACGRDGDIWSETLRGGWVRQ